MLPNRQTQIPQPKEEETNDRLAQSLHPVVENVKHSLKQLQLSDPQSIIRPCTDEREHSPRSSINHQRCYIVLVFVDPCRSCDRCSHGVIFDIDPLDCGIVTCILVTATVAPATAVPSTARVILSTANPATASACSRRNRIVNINALQV